METFKAYFNKEVLESKRQFRYLIIFLAFIFLALENPILIKLMPKLLESSGIKDASQISGLVPTDKLQIMGGLILKDLVQIGILVVAFTFCNILSDELNSQKFVFPFSKGAKPSYIVLAKSLHYSLTIAAAVAAAIFVNYYYVGIIFTDGKAPAIPNVIFSILLVSLFFIFTFVLTMFFSLIFKKGIAAGIITALIQYLSALPSQIKAIQNFVPYNLLKTASEFKISNVTILVISTLVYIIILLFVSIAILNKKDLMQ